MADPLSTIRGPLNTITAKGSQGALVTAWLAKHYTGIVGQVMERPLGTVTATDHHSLVAAHITKWYGTGSCGSDLHEPLHTVTSRDRMALVSAFLTNFYGTSTGADVREPTVTGGGGHLGVVTVDIGGEEYAIVDIGMRMLQPRELARAQGFDDSYHLSGTKTEQIARIGNSVPPQVVEAIVRAQFGLEAAAVK